MQFESEVGDLISKSETLLELHLSGSQMFKDKDWRCYNGTYGTT